MQQHIVVTGMGILSAIGQNIREYASALHAGKSGIGWLKKKEGPSISVKIAAELRDFSFDKLLQQHTSLPETLIQHARLSAQRSPFTIQASVAATLEAWEGACLHREPLDSERIGLIVAGHNLTQQYKYEQFPKFHQQPEYLSPRYPLHIMDTDQVGTLSELLEIQGEGFTIGGASASGNVGIIKGCQQIQSGLTDVCCVVGALTDLSPMDLQGFYNIGAMGGKHFHDVPEHACRPFDKKHEGFIYGQASACLILESSVSAAQRGVRPLAEIAGGSLVLDGHRLSAPSENAEFRAMRNALQQAGMQSEVIDYVNAHGSSSPLGDDTEIRALKKVFGERISQVWLNSTKSLTGHCLYSAGVVEAIATIIQIQEGFVHPNKNLVHPIDDECRFAQHEASPAELKTAISNSFGFGGIHSSIVIKKWS